MIIASSKEGQLCNRLFHLSHFIAFSLENTIRIWYPFFDDYLPYFPNLATYTSNSKLISFRSSSSIRFFFKRIWPFIFLRTARHLRTNIINANGMFYPDNPQFISISSARNVFISGFLFRSPDNFRKHSDKIRSLFKFDSSTELTSDQAISNLKGTPHTKIVGIHVRRGDYQSWKNGEFFFDNETYASAMKQMQSNLTSLNFPTAFLIVTNDPKSIHKHAFEELPYFLSNNSEIIDLCLLSKCDYIIGPPSTFSSWASFYGKVPYLHLNSKDEIVNMSKFLIND